MNKNIHRLLLAATLCLTLLLGQADASERKLEFAKATRQEIRHQYSESGIRNTLLFYTFGDQKAVLRMEIDNKDTTFPVNATIYLFADDTTKEGIEKWINNQHSDALHTDVPEPTLTQPLPAGRCSITEHKALAKKKSPTNTEMFQDYEVTLKMEACEFKDKLTLTAFTDKTKVYVKLKD